LFEIQERRVQRRQTVRHGAILACHARDVPSRSPKDTFITVYGRKPVLEALTDPALTVDKIITADNARGDSLSAILSAARARGVPVQRASAHRVKVLAGNGRHDQGVLADVIAPAMRPLADYLEELADLPADTPCALLVLDAVTNPANVGMVLRSATAAGLDGVVMPRRGVPAIDPLVIKASAGVAFRARVLRAATAAEACALLKAAGIRVLGLTSGAPTSLLHDPLPERLALVLGNETEGLSEEVRGQLDGTVSIPMRGGVESLNVASAAAVASYELLRRREAR
jgi:23S rRNA (guanosine2251-2'-O)-methyltransferase